MRRREYCLSTMPGRRVPPALPSTSAGVVRRAGPRWGLRRRLVLCPRVRGQAGKRPARPLRPPSGVQGAQPPPGVQRVPLFPKTSEGGPGGTTAVRHLKPHSLSRTRGQVRNGVSYRQLAWSPGLRPCSYWAERNAMPSSSNCEFDCASVRMSVRRMSSDSP